MTCVFKKLETDIVIDFNWSEAKSKWFQRKKRKMIEEERKWAASEPHEPLPLWLAELPQVKLTAIDRPGRLRPLFTFNQPLPLITPQTGRGGLHCQTTDEQHYRITSRPGRGLRWK